MNAPNLLRVKVTDENRRAYQVLKISRNLSEWSFIASFVFGVAASSHYVVLVAALSLLGVAVISFVIRIVVMLTCFLRYSLRTIFIVVLSMGFLIALFVGVDHLIARVITGSLILFQLWLCYKVIEEREPR